MYYIPGYIKIIYNNDYSTNLINSYTNKEITIDQKYNETLSSIISKGTDSIKEEVASFLHSNDFLLTEKEFIDEIHSYYEDNDYFLRFIMMPTEGCNFRCTYCYENHNKKEKKLDYETIYSFMEDKVKEKEWKQIIINWFGGEPLLKIKEIQSFSETIKSLRDNYPIISSITTNGYTLTNHNISILEKAGILNYQITIDGEEQDKTRILSDGSPTYFVIMENLKTLKDHPIQSCQIRVNITDTSSNNEPFYHEVSDIIQADDRFTLDIHKVFESDYYKLSNYEKLDLIHKENIKIAESLNLAIDLDTPNILQCYGAQRNCYTFRHDGSIVKCTVALDDEWNQIGKVNGHNVELYDSNETDCLNDLSKCFKCINITNCKNLSCSKAKNKRSECNYEERK